MTDESPLTSTTEEGDESAPEQSRRWRRPLAAFLAVVAALSLVLAVTATWMNNTLLDTDTWVETVASLPSDPELQQLVAAEVADEVLTVIDLPNLMEGALGPAGKFLAAPAQDASRGFIEDATVEVLASPEFEEIWLEANRVAHSRAVKVLKGESDVANVVDGQVTLDLVPLINNVVADISQNIPELFGGVVSIPAVSADQVDQATQNLADSLGITLPPDFGQIPVFDAAALTTAQDVVALLDGGMIALWVLFVLALVGSIVASIDRRRTVAFVGITTAVTALVVWVMRRPLETDIVDEIKNPSGKQATEIVIDVTLWNNLGPLILALVGISLVAAGIAFIVGPSRSAVTIRRSAVGLLGDHQPQTAASVFMRKHTSAFRIAGAAAAIFALFTIPDLTFWWFLTVVVILLAYEVSWSYVAPMDDSPSEQVATTS